MSERVQANAPTLRQMRFDDYDKVRALLVANALQCPPFEDWRHRWVDNPLWQRSGDAMPIGWVLETATGDIVGSMESIPMGYKFRGADLVAAASAAWCTQEAYRGYALQLIDEYFSQPVDLFVSTTVGPAAVSTLSQFYGPIPLGRWDVTSYFVTAHVAFARRALQKCRVRAATPLAYPLGWMLSIKDALFNQLPPPSPSDISIETVEHFDERFDNFWGNLLRQNPEKLLAVRSSRALWWHFDAAIRGKRLWIFTASKAARLCGYCVFRQESAAGGQSMCLIDYQSIENDRDLLPGFLRKALGRCAEEGYYILQNFGVGVPKMRAFDDRAPYRGKLPNPIFFYSADARIENELKNPQVWDPSLFDGDAAL